jgi:acyl-CoA dehydrogenase
MEHFIQDPPRLGNQYDEDRVLRSHLRRVLPPEVLTEIEPELREMGRLSGEVFHPLMLEDRENEPRLVQWDAWGRRIDRIDPTRLWREAEHVAARHGVLATAYERSHGSHSRVHQFALAYLFAASTDIYACPLAMTDGAARTLIESGNERLIRRAVPRLTSRDPVSFWTSGQWMTEAVGGSDVGLSETVARHEDGGWKLYGLKWFTSAAASQMALTLARPEGNPSGGKGLALFYVEARDAGGGLNGTSVRRLKDKLGTRKLPTAELELDGTTATLVGHPSDGVRAMATMLNLTRTWNAVTAVSLMHKGIALARDFGRRRVAFGAPLSGKPLWVETLAGMQAEFEGALQLAFRVAQLMGRSEAGGLDREGENLLRALTPVAKLTTAKQAVDVVTEAMEALGGAGYLEDSGLPTLLRDAHVLPIWEGTTSVLSLELLRALREEGAEPLVREVERATAGVSDPGLRGAAENARSVARHARDWLEGVAGDQDGRESGAARFALTMGRALELALLCEQAQWALEREKDGRAAAAARRLATLGIDRLLAADPQDAALLAEG